MTIVVAWDRKGIGDSAYYKVKPDTNLLLPAAYTDNVDVWPKSELDMGSGTSLRDFVTWGMREYPAAYYALFISDHGTGLSGVALDTTGAIDWIEVKELGEALGEATGSGEIPIDVLFADACLMAMVEDAYELQGFVDYYVASENLIWITHDDELPYPYSGYVSSITATTTPRDLAKQLVAQYASWMNAVNAYMMDKYGTSLGYTLSAADLSQLDPLVAAVNALGQRLRDGIAGGPTFVDQVSASREAAQKFDSDRKGLASNRLINTYDEYVDLSDFATQLQAISDPDLQAKAQDVVDAVASYIIEDGNVAHSGDGSRNFPNLGGSHGVSIFFPKGDWRRSFYTDVNIGFASGATWLTLPAPGPGLAGEVSTTWGPMLVDYVGQLTPSALDDPNPPELAAPLVPYWLAYLPLVLTGF